MPQYLCRMQPVRAAMLTEAPTSQEAEIVNEHFVYLKELTEAGTVILAGRTVNTDSSSFGIVIFNAEDDDAANTLVQNDPAVKNRVMRAEVFPYYMALMDAENLQADA